MQTTQKIRRIFIADPSFQDWLGHHAPYDLAIKKAADEMHVHCEIFANMDLSVGEDFLDGVTPVFSRTAWGKITAKSGKISQSDMPAKYLGTILFYIFAAIGAVIKYIRPFYAKVQPKKYWPRIKRVCKWFTPPIVLELKKILKLLLPPIVHGILIRIPGTLREMPMPHWLGWLCAMPALTEYYELRYILTEKGFTDGDVLFMHMITGHNFAMCALLANCIAHRKQGGEIILLFRYPKHFIPNRINNKIACRMLEQAFLKGNVRGATDSSLLAKEYAKFLAVPLIEYPIPHLPSFEVRQKEAAYPLCCISLGNARAEKGILEIFEAIRILKQKNEAQNFIFKLQVNDPDSESADAVEKFIAEQHDNVELFTDALPPDVYENLLAQADIVLAPYWSDVYAARTSGVFLEAVAAGKPIITTKNSWMAHETEKLGGATTLVPSRNPEAIAQALNSIVENHEAHEAMAEHLAQQCGTFHNRGRVLAHILNQIPSRSISTNADILIIYPFDDLVENKSGAATRVHYLYKFLSAAGYNIEVLVPEQKGSIQPRINVKIYQETKTLLNLPTLIRRVFCDSMEGWVLQMLTKSRSRNFKLNLTESLLGKQAVFAEYAFNLPYIAPYTKAYNIPLVATAHDRHAEACTTQKIQNEVSTYEVRALNQADFAATVAESDSINFANLGVRNTCIASAFDIQVAQPTTPYIHKTLHRFGISDSKPLFMFIGSAHEPNILAKEYLKELANKMQNLQWSIVIVGTCGAPQETKDNFIVTGPVSEKTREALYAASTVVLSPLPSGTGASVKTVEAMGRGKIILGSTATFRNLKVISGIHCIIEDNINMYIEKIHSIMEDSSFRKNIEKKAKEFAQQYDYRNCFKPYTDFIKAWPTI